jgi:thiol:disulfide interchange protein DsbA|tara:strand:- start:31371 stop:32006 length:636 start_codon:yes stop_codon:yes gene_type:complete
MLQLIRTGFFTLLTSVLIMTAVQADGHGRYREGQHYLRLATPLPALEPAAAKHEVVELFWYGCSHCNDFDPYLEVWKVKTKADVNLVRVPAIFNPRWEQHARAYYALELMGELDNVHTLIFEAIHDQGRSLHNVGSMARFLASHGVDKDQFREAFDSFVVETKINRAKQLIRDYQVTGVPAIIVDGTYKVSGSTAGGYQQLIGVIEQLTSD